MASSGQLNTGGYNGRYFEFNWWLSDINNSNNSALFNWNLIARAGNATWYNVTAISVVINGQQRFFSGNGQVNCYKDSVFASGNFWVNGGSGISVQISRKYILLEWE